MPRPKRCRKACSMPRVSEFAPIGEEADFVVLTVDEYESVRLIDKQGFSQEECAAYMQVKGLRIAGEDYRLCDGKETFCSCGGCSRHCMENH